MKTPPLTSTRCKSIIKQYAKQRIMVIGDVMLDEYLWGEVTRISPEAPVPIVEIASATLKLGGAANVACNLHALGIQTLLIGICGDDANSQRLRKLMIQQGLSPDGLVKSPVRPTTMKTRIMAQHQQIVRADHELRKSLDKNEESRLMKKIISRLDGVTAIILSDYSKGVLSDSVLQRVMCECKARNIFVAVDPKRRFFEGYIGAELLTPNLKEAHQALGIPYRHCSTEETKEMGWKLMAMLGLPMLLITMGEGGMALFEAKGHQFTHMDTVARKVFDVTGAGDTVISVFAASIASGATPKEAAVLANQAAGLSVAELGTASVSPQDIIKEFAR